MLSSAYYKEILEAVEDLNTYLYESSEDREYVREVTDDLIKKLNKIKREAW